MEKQLNVKVGDKVCLISYGRRISDEPKKRIVTVSKVGRKYFSVTVDGFSYFNNVQFYLRNGEEKTEYSSSHKVYETEKEYDEYVEKCDLDYFFKGVFSSYGRSKLSLECLREMKKTYDFYQPVKED